ncbi:MAG: CHAT domain-containing protein [Lewinellaceae bacterium]|nr:CHAT domain-containing protein [Lewinellaceae bacterium]
MHLKRILPAVAVLLTAPLWLFGADTLRARALVQSADAAAESGDREKAAEYLDQAAAIWKQENLRNYLETALDAALLYDNSETRKEAIRRAGLLAEAIDPETFPDKSKLGYFYHKYAAMYHNDGQFEKALELYRLALTIRKSLDENNLDAALTANNMGIACRSLGRYEEAIGYFQYSAGIREKRKESLLSGRVWFEIGRLYETMGDFDAAASAFNRALGFYSQSKKNNAYYLNAGGAWLSLGNVANRANEPQRAINCYLKAEELFALTDEKEEKQSLCYQNLGNIYDDLGDWDNALKYYHKALDLARKTQQSERAAFIESNLGFTLTRQNKLKEAKNYLETSLGHFKTLFEAQYDPEYAKPLVNLGDVDTANQHYTDALRHYHEALQQVIPATRSANWQQDPELNDTTLILGEPYYVLAYLKAKARGWQLLGFHEKNADHHRHAIFMYRQAVAYQDRILREMIADQSRLIWLEQSRAMFENALRSCFAIGDAASAFYFMEKSRAVLLLDALLANRARNLIPDSLSQKESALKSRLADAQQAMAADPGKPDLRQNLLDAQRALNDFLKQLSQSYPQYHNARYNADVVGLETARMELLTEGKSLIVYFYGESHLYALRLPWSGEPGLTSVPADSALRNTLRDYLQQFSPANRWNMRPDIFGLTASTLFDKIYRPVYSPDDSQVIIIPDGELGYIPFDALLVSASGQGGWKSLDYLARHQVLQQGFSAGVLVRQQQLGHSTNTNYLLAPGFASGEQGQAPLPFDGFSGQDNGNMTVFTGAEARRSLLNNWTKGGEILHFFTHAEAGDHPRIYFIDSLLQLPELYATTLPFDLVILSACETNIGQLARGEGVMSLSRGFAYAGAASLMASLWQVKPQASAEILNRFYTLIKGGDTRAGALRQAKIDYLESAPEMRAMPSYWAGMVMNGKDGKVPLSGKPGWLIWGVGLCLAAGASFLAGRRKKTAALILAGMTLGLNACKPDGPEWKLTWSETGNPADVAAVFPSLFQSGDGKLWQTWLHEPDTLSRLMIAGLGESGWSVPVQIASDPDWFVNWADFPSVFARNDSFLATYVLMRHGEGGVYAYDIGLYLSPDAGQTWQGPLIPHKDDTATEHGFVSMTALPDDRIGLAWLDGRKYAVQSGTPEGGEADMTLRFAAVDREGNLSDEAELDGRTCSCCQTDAATLADGSIVVVYRDRSMAEVRDIALVKRQNGVWSEPRLVHADNWTIEGCPVNGPAVAASGNRLAVAWFTAAEEKPGVFLVWSEDGGDSFGQPVQIDKGNPEGRVDVQLLDDERALVSWVEREKGGKGALRLSVVDPSGRLLAEDRVADFDPARSSGFPRLAARDGRFFLAWTAPGKGVRMVGGE